MLSQVRLYKRILKIIRGHILELEYVNGVRVDINEARIHHFPVAGCQRAMRYPYSKFIKGN